MDRLVPWLVFGLVVALVVSVGSIGLAFLLPGAAEGGGGGPFDGSRAGRPFSWDGDRVVERGGILTPLWAFLLVVVPLSLLSLSVTGLAWANRGGGRNATRRQAPCPACGQEMEPDWRLCPYCGEWRDNARDG